MEQTQRGQEQRADEKEEMEGKPTRQGKGEDRSRASGTTLHAASGPAKDASRAKQED